MRHPQGLLAGMLWFDPDKPDALSNIRHLALEGDGGAHSYHTILQQLGFVIRCQYVLLSTQLCWAYTLVHVSREPLTTLHMPSAQVSRSMDGRRMMVNGMAVRSSMMAKYTLRPS